MQGYVKYGNPDCQNLHGHIGQIFILRWYCYG